MKIRLHKESGLWVREDGAVLMPPGGHFRKFRWTYGYKRKDGYMVVRYRGKDYKVHRLVAETFIPNQEGYSTVDHIDRNPSNNAVSNLRWADRKLQNNNRQVCEDCLAKYGVRYCEDKNAYQRAYRAANPEFAERERARCRDRYASPEFAERKHAKNREWKAKQKALGKRNRRCPDGKRRLLTNEEYAKLKDGLR
jgi:hypothetical protein